MATHYADIRLQLAVARTFQRLRAMPQPSWPTALAAVAVALVTMWWIMSQRVPDIDPRSVIVANLAAAEHAARQERFIEPLDRSALHYYAAVLAIDPANEAARRGLDSIAAHYVERTKTSIVTGRIADAAVALDDLRRVQPNHRRIALLDAQLRRAIEEQAISRSPAPAREQKEDRTAKDVRVATRPAREAPVKKAAAPTVAPSVERAPAPKNDATTRLATIAAPTTPNASATHASSTQPIQSAPPPVEAAASETAPTVAAPIAAPPPTAEGAGQAVAPMRERTLVKYVPPEYPREAMMRGVEGYIDVRLTVTPAGDVVDPMVEGGKARQLFDRPALSAVRRWKYEPRPDQTTPHTLQVRVSFQLKD